MAVSQVLTGAGLSANWNPDQKSAFQNAVSQAMGVNVVDPSDVVVESVTLVGTGVVGARQLQQSSVRVDYRIKYDVDAINQIAPGNGEDNKAAYNFLQGKLASAVAPQKGGGLSVFTESLQQSSSAFARAVSATTVSVQPGPVEGTVPSSAPTKMVQQSSTGAAADNSQLFGTIGIILGVILFVVILATYLWIRRDFQKSAGEKMGEGNSGLALSSNSSAAGSSSKDVALVVSDDTVGENPLYSGGSATRRQSGLIGGGRLDGDASDPASVAPKRLSVQNVAPRKAGEAPVPGATSRSAPPPPPTPPPAVVAEIPAPPETTEPPLVVAVPVAASKPGVVESQAKLDSQPVVPPPPTPPPEAPGAPRQFGALRAPPPPPRASLAISIAPPSGPPPPIEDPNLKDDAL